MDSDCEAWLRVVAQKPARGRGPSIGGRSQSAQLGPCARLVLAIGARHRQPSCRVDFAWRWWHERAAYLGLGSRADENVFFALLHLVERGDLRHAGVDLALWRVRG